jgi:cytochrome c peroxidase
VTSSAPVSKGKRGCNGPAAGYHGHMNTPGRSRPRAVVPAGVLAVLTTFVLPACGGGGEEGEHETGHDGGIEVHVGRVPPAPPKEEGIDVAALRERAKKVLGVVPKEFPNPDNELTEAKIDLGRQLYYDGRLSLSGDISCNSCHPLNRYGADGLPTSPGHEAQFGERNSPTVYNAGGHLAQFWDGRAATLEDQAKGPILNPIEMAMPSEEAAVAAIAAVPAYVEAFAKAFPDAEEPVTYDNIAKAIAAFERRLVTPATFDRWLEGDDGAMSEPALAGLKLFLDTDCQSCHSGFNLGGASYQKLGTEKPWAGLKDNGRFVVTQDERDRFVFKVPTLRNVTETGPYLHNGSIATLPEMVSRMVEHQTKRAGPFTEEEMANMLAFLGTLTGELPTDYIAEPELPAGDDAAADEPEAETKDDGGDEAEAKPKPKPEPKNDEAEAEAKPKPKPKPEPKDDEAEG